MKIHTRSRPRVVAPHPEGVVSLSFGRTPGLSLLLCQNMEGPSRPVFRIPGMKTTPHPVPVVAYLRVSTKEQQQHGLSLEAQEQQVRALAEQIGGEVIRVISEQASGRKVNRPGLAEALALATRCRGVLAVARLDRLSRSVAKVASTLAAGVQVRVADSPNASTLELHLRATIAEEEALLISARTKEGLRVAKQRGTKLGFARPGSRQGRTKDGRSRSKVLAEARAEGARRSSESARIARAGTLAEAAPIIAANQGQSLRTIAAALEDAGVFTTRGCRTWTATAVSRLMGEMRASEMIG